MATEFDHYESTHPGITAKGANKFHISDKDKKYRYHSANVFSSALGGKKTLLGFGGWMGYSSAQGTETKDNSATILMGADGVEFKTQATPSDNDDISFVSLRTKTIAANKIFKLTARLKVSNATNLGFVLGFVTSGTTDVFGSAPADGVYFIKAKNAATLTGRVIENSQTADDLTTFNIAGAAAGSVSAVADTFQELGIEFKAGSSAGNSFGNWIIDGVITPMSSDQVTAVYTMLATTAATLSAFVQFRVNSTTQRTGTVDFLLAQADE